ncbi:MAG: ABC transporter ATP-binding protein [Johnsonella sp.]|nr:ABC transporter ATP-binding protein [Johnsonella sp.]
MKKLGKYFKHYKKEALLSPLFKLLEAGLELLVPLIVASMIDRGIRGGDTGHILRMTLLLIFFAVSGMLFAITAQYFAAKLALGYVTELRDDLFAHIMRLSHAEADLLGKDTLTTRLVNDTAQIQAGVNLCFRLVLRSPLIVFGALFMASLIDLRQAMIFFVVILLLFLVVFLIMKHNVRRYKSVQKNVDRITGKISENLSGVRVLRAFHAQEGEKKAFNLDAKELNEKQNAAGRLSGLLNPLTYIIINLGIVALLKIGAADVGSKRLSGGELIALVNYMGQILVELLKLANLIILLAKSLASAKRVGEIFDIRSSLREGEEDFKRACESFDAKEGFIEFCEVGFAYPLSSANAIEKISFRVRKGESIGIIGGTGSGKSTLMHLLPRFYDTGEGRILIAGRNIQDYSLSSLRSKIALVDQENRLFQGSIASNLEWGKQNPSEEEMEAAAEAAQALSFIREKRDAFHEKVFQKGRNFSGGQRQRLSIARALIKEADILILDDASSALDYLTDARLREAIGRLKKDLTLFIVSQRVAGIASADRIIVLDEGRIAGMGTHSELLENCGIYQEICRSQEMVQGGI